MAERDDTRPDFNPRHRIVGAIVLVALVVIFVPMILDERAPPDLKAGREALPRVDTGDTRVVVTPVPAPEVKPVESGVVHKAASPAESKPAPATRPEEKPAETRKPEPVPEKLATTTAGKTGDGWMVQVGTFSNTQNALRLRDKLKSLGHSVHADSVAVGGKKAMRLRVGPFADRAKADKAQAQIRKETGVAGVVQAQS
jgi:DedD protein